MNSKGLQEFIFYDGIWTLLALGGISLGLLGESDSVQHQPPSYQGTVFSYQTRISFLMNH